jgi:hypothetical protein
MRDSCCTLLVPQHRRSGLPMPVLEHMLHHEVAELVLSAATCVATSRKRRRAGYGAGGEVLQHPPKHAAAKAVRGDGHPRPSQKITRRGGSMVMRRCRT